MHVGAMEPILCGWPGGFLAQQLSALMLRWSLPKYIPPGELEKQSPASNLLVHSTLQAGLAPRLHLQGHCSFPQPAAATTPRGPVQNPPWLPSDLAASRGDLLPGHLLWLVWAGSALAAPSWGLGRAWEHAAVSLALRPRPNTEHLPQAPALGLRPSDSGRDAACTEHAGIGWNDLREYVIVKGIAVT